MAEQMMQEAEGKAIPAGYKQTEVGVIPEDWGVNQLSSLTIKIIDNRGKTPPLARNGEYELIETASISFVGMYPDYSKVTKSVSKDTYENWFRGHPKINDVLVSTVGEYSGASALMGLNRGTIAQNLIAIRFSESIDSKFIFYWTRSSLYRSQLDQVMMNQAQPSLRVPWLLCFRLPIPSKQEQTAIANVLSDSDALIDALEQLIAKKQAIKSATMQQLLTGRTRLPAFALHPDGTPKGYKPSELGDIPEDWEACFLADIANLKNGYAFKSADYCSHGKYCIVTIACVQNGYMNILDSNKLNKLPFDIQSHQILTRGSLLISMTGNVGRVAKVECDDLLLNQRVGLIESKNIDRDFLFYLLRNPTFLSDMEEKAVGGAQGNIGKDDILSYSLIKPACNKEQTAIATILSDMDNELQALTQKLEKARALKQGMMQQLLTGKIRLPLPPNTTQGASDAN